jgi:hypothetical protein
METASLVLLAPAYVPAIVVAAAALRAGGRATRGRAALLPYLTAVLAKEGGAETLRGTNEAAVAFFDAGVRGEREGWGRVRAARARFSYDCTRLPGREG